jgi:hypothetical protein
MCCVGLQGEAVDASVVRPEPVAETPVGGADRPERLLVGLDRRWERLLLVLEEDLSPADGVPSRLRGSPLKPTWLVALPRLTAMT